MTLHEQFRAAAALVRKQKRLPKGAFMDHGKDGSKCYCLVGALGMVGYYHRYTATDYKVTRWLTATMLGDTVGEGTVSLLAQFNDDRNTRKRDIVALFEIAADIAYEKGL
jgi:hypothetical protein